MSEGKMIVISGFSGAGKGTLMKELMRLYADKYALSISAPATRMTDERIEEISHLILNVKKEIRENM